VLASTAVRILFATWAMGPPPAHLPLSQSNAALTPVPIDALNHDPVDATDYVVWRCYDYATGAVSDCPETDPMPHIPLERYSLDSPRTLRRYRAYLSRRTSWRAAVAWGSAYPLRAPMHLRENERVRRSLTGNDEFDQFARWYALSADESLVCVRRSSFSVVSTIDVESASDMSAPSGIGSAAPAGFVNHPDARLLFKTDGDFFDLSSQDIEHFAELGKLQNLKTEPTPGHLCFLDQRGRWHENKDVLADNAATSPAGDRILIFRWIDTDQYELEMRSADLTTTHWCEVRRLRPPDDGRVINLGFSEDGRLACVWSRSDRTSTSSLTCFEAANGEYLRRVTLPFSAHDGPWMIDLADREPDLHERFGLDVLEPLRPRR